jgi:PAS domain S-box-containing protein
MMNSKRFKISLTATILIILIFMVIKSMSFFDMIENSKSVQLLEFISFILYIPSFHILMMSVFNNYKRLKIENSKLEEMLHESSLVSKTDSRGIITEVNDNFCNVSGYKRHELLGKDHRILNSGTHPKDFWKNMYESTVKYRVIWNEIVTNRNKNESRYVVNSWIKAMFDDRDNHIGFISVRHNITDLYNSLDSIKEKEEELSGIIEAINKSSATIEFCTNGFIIDANSNFLKLTGYSLHEITGKHHSIFMDDHDINTKSYEKFWDDLKSGKSKDGQYMMISKNDEVLWFNSTYNPIFDSTGKIVKILCISTDITAAVNQKMDLERKNSYLEHSAKILRHDMHSGINTYIPRGISSLERRIDKIAKEANISPEKLETALGSSMKLIKEGLSHAQRVYIGVREFTNLVKKDSILETELCDLSKALKDYLKSTAYLSQVSISDLGIENVNCSLFCTALDNLIRNGLKYNDSDTKLVKVYRDRDNIIVEDNGRGMTQREFEEYSKPYARKHGNRESGSGLGLNICIAIIKEHGWEIGLIKSRKGTKIKISMNK